MINELVLRIPYSLILIFSLVIQFIIKTFNIIINPKYRLSYGNTLYSYLIKVLFDTLIMSTEISLFLYCFRFYPIVSSVVAIIWLLIEYTIYYILSEDEYSFIIKTTILTEYYMNKTNNIYKKVLYTNIFNELNKLKKLD